MADKIKALTVWQPWATLIAIEAMRYETRDWTHNYRGPLAIHAAKSRRGHGICHTEPFYTILKNAGYLSPKWLPHGEIVAVCELVAIIRITDTNATDLSRQERTFRDFTPGRYAWDLQDVCKLEFPVPIQGQRGLWTWDYS